jgi:hypothetical protein
MADYRINLTDGTTTIDLYAGSIKIVEGGLSLGPPTFEGQYVTSPYADGNNLASARFGNRIITLRLKATGATLAALTTNIRTIHRLLTDAAAAQRNKWEAQGLLTASGRVYLELQWGDSAGASTYFEVVSGHLSYPDSLYSPMLATSKVVIPMVLELECKPFGLYTAQDIAQDILTNGTVNTTALTKAWAADGAALTDETTEANDAAANDMTLLPAVPAGNDAYYFGYLGCPFTRMTLNIGTAGVGVWTITWEYWNGSAWTALSGVTDDTTGFTAAAGSHAVTWTMPADWARTTVSDATARYYVRARVSAYTSIVTQPLGTQAWLTPVNYQDIVTAEAYGDVPAGLYIKIDQTGATGSKKIWIAKRTGARYDDDLWTEGEAESSETVIFSEANITLAGSDQADAACSAGNYRRMRLTHTLTAAQSIITGQIMRWNYSMATPPRGSFRVLIRAKCTENSADTLTYAAMGWGVGYSYGGLTVGPSEYLYPAADNTYQIFDLGLINIPPIAESDVAGSSAFELRIFGYSSGGNLGLAGAADTADWILDYVFLLPVDEGVVIIDSVAADDILAIDAITDPPNVFKIVSDLVSAYPSCNGAPFTLGRKSTRIYVLRDDVPAATFTVDTKYQPRFLGI